MQGSLAGKSFVPGFLVASVLGRAVLLALVLQQAFLLPASAEPLVIAAKPVFAFDSSDPKVQRFGKLEFLGGLELSSSHEDFGGLSAIRWIRGSDRFIAVTDKARIVTAKVVRTRDGAAQAITDARITRIAAANGRTITGADDKDSESLALVGKHVVVGYERNDRIAFLREHAGRFGFDPDTLPIDLSDQNFPFNKGVEALAYRESEGELIAFAEHALNENGNHSGMLIRNGKITRSLELVYKNRFSVTDAQFSRDGDLFVLERYYSPFLGVFMRIRRVDGARLASRSPFDGETLIEADGKMEIDNMEGLALSEDAEGNLRLTLVSDDNFSASQRTLLLEFLLRQ